MNKVFTLKLPADVFARLREAAHKRGISIAALVREAIEKMLEG
jgi:predicted DNA-binding protein